MQMNVQAEVPWEIIPIWTGREGRVVVTIPSAKAGSVMPVTKEKLMTMADNTGDKGPNTHWAHCEHIENTGNM